MSPCSLGRRHYAGHAVAHEARLLAALDLEREAGHHLPPAAALLVDGDDLGLGADLGVDRDRGRKADLVPAVVDTEGEAAGGDQLLAEAVDERERQVAVSDRRAEGTFPLSSLDVDVDPLVVARELGEGVDVVLGNRPPLAWADLLPEHGLHSLDAVDLDRRHRRRRLPQGDMSLRGQPLREPQATEVALAFPTCRQAMVF
jgi:hypothetical protein